jgi:hypothetical protein
MEPRGSARHRWENREVDWAGAHESKREPNEFQSRKGISQIEGKAARVAASDSGSRPVSIHTNEHEFKYSGEHRLPA